MPSGPPPIDDVRALLVTLLAGATGRHETHWSKLIAIERTSIVDDIRTNWRLVATGSKRDREAIDHAVVIVRGQHPYVRW